MSDTAQREAALAPAAKLGGELRARRQSLGWELPDLAQSLRIRQPYLEAIEAGRIGELPGLTYALGFVRAYATALGLPGEQMASRFRAETGGSTIRPALSFPAPVPQRGVPAGALMLLGLLILAGAYSGWYYMSEHQRTPAETVPPIPDRLRPAVQKPAPSPQVASLLPTASAPAPQPQNATPAPQPQNATPAPQPQSATPALQSQNAATGAQVRSGVPQAQTLAPALTAHPPLAPATQSTPAAQTVSPAPAARSPVQSTTPATAQTAPAAPAPAGATPAPAGTRIVVKANADAWITIKQPGGPPALNKLMHAGETWAVPADKPGLLLTTGNAGGTELDVDGTPILNLGGSGAVRRDLKLDADALKAGPLPAIGHGRKAAMPADQG